MPSDKKMRVLAIAIDSVERTLVERMLTEAKLPGLSSVLSGGRWTTLDSTVPQGDGSVWPSFLTGQTPHEHGTYAEWLWEPNTMSVRRFAPVEDSFLRGLLESGIRIGLFDVPFAPFLEVDDGFEVNEWGVHEPLIGRMRSSPSTVGRWAASYSHPYGANPFVPDKKNDLDALERLVNEAHQGLEERGALSRKLISETHPQFVLIDFAETHHLGHHMWHAIESEHEIYGSTEFREIPSREPFEEVIRAVDDQLAGLLELCDSNTSVVIFALHGMKAALDIPMFFYPLLRNRGFSAPPGWRALSWRKRAKAAAKNIKSHAPNSLRQLYRRRVDAEFRARVAQSSVLEEQDWQRTTAFQLPPDHHASIRVNVRGRERDGIVDKTSYEELCSELREIIGSAKASNGSPLVERVVQLDPKAFDPMKSPLPDLMVEWSTAAYLPDVEVPEDLDAPPLYQVRTGHHSANAFCVAGGPIAEMIPDPVKIEDLHKFLIEASIPDVKIR